MSIKLINIEKNFGNKKIYDKFSLTFEEGKINCILGKSGCGKSTLLNIIANLEEINSGEIIGVPEKIAYVFQEDRLIEWNSIYTNMELPLLKFYTKDEREEKIKNILREVELEYYINSYPKELSGGMRQRANIARALLYNGELLLMDEPFKSLDKSSKENIIKIFKKNHLEKNNTVIMVTHDINEALSLGDNIFILGGSPAILMDKFKDVQRSKEKNNIEDKILLILKE
ncbi:ABC transporter ATP-binding protein [Clostridium perfringens]|uniref:ABC transporter ATP-binding protein n=1 Tax=Clostridium perfringens TaxID=1502 RepID=UPI002978AAA9|nr:ABC transporter ATP-binding protein [Clostridium perfringens]MDM0474894.1 ABC transporter ATP-binding protein [Clostridium perfringens]MDM0477048.1 ABC transporter ATP-binding protein [Clostridium perfringens]MDM0479643.1 ABC transporter ATP-binding protein [Clostridium perfringens]MDM0482505.1 ABC transporter ATP-binding protein [Clostridium perfringens]